MFVGILSGTLLCLLILTIFLSAATTSSLGVHFIRAPESAFASDHDEVMFDCEVNLKPDRLEWSYRPMKSGPSGAFKYLKHSIPRLNITHGELTTKLRIFVTADLLGEYRCVGWFGPVALTSTSARLSLATISNYIQDGESSMTWHVTPNNSFLIRCGGVASQPTAVWSFYRNSVKLQADESRIFNGALAINAVKASDAGTYTCSAMNTVTGKVVMSARHIEVIVDLNYKNRIPPHFLDFNIAKNLTARLGDTIILECPGIGTPVPKSVWSSPNVANILSSNHTKVLSYGLKIVNITAEHAGMYICRLDNGVLPPLVRKFELTVHEPPIIVKGPEPILANEGDGIELQCNAKGKPRPEIYWLINDANASKDSEIVKFKDRLQIRHVQKRHAGNIQCFARNYLGEDSMGSRMEVNARQIQSDDVRVMHTKHKKKRKNGRNMQMVPPSSPNVTRLSDESVMLRWQVLKNDGLPIQFFKVQYRTLGGNSSGSRENWQTTNEDIPFGKRSRNGENGKSFTSSVTGLEPERFYRFRIVAVYSNKDNKESNTSSKFFLQRGSALGLSESGLPTPELVDIKPYSETAVILQWALTADPKDQIEGFYAYYRPSSSAGEYYKLTIEGSKLRKFKIGMLEPNTIYEFKLQSFNSYSASDFSNFKQGRTLKLQSADNPTSTPPVTSTTPKSNETNPSDILMAGSVSGGSLLLVALFAMCCLRRRKHAPTGNDNNKPHFRDERQVHDDFATLNSKVYAQSNSRTRSLNGVRTNLHITMNPLVQHEKTAPLKHDQTSYFQPQSNDEMYDSLESSFSCLPAHDAPVRCAMERDNNNKQSFDDLIASCGSIAHLQDLHHSPKQSHGDISRRTHLSSNRADNLASISLNSIKV